MTVYLYSMKVRVSTRMKGGRILPWNGQPLCAEGIFVVFMKERGGRSVPALHVCGDTLLSTLFDARIISIGESKILVAGEECIDGEWLAQEWECRILSLQDAPSTPLNPRVPTKARS